MIVLLYSTPGPAEPWRAALAAALPGAEIRAADSLGDPAEIEYLIVAQKYPEDFSVFRGLRLIVSLLAGVEALLARPALPDVPLARSGAAGGDDMISDAALLHVLRHHRNMPEYADSQRHAEWARIAPRPVADRRVGFMGLGNIGLPAAQRVRDFGFQVSAWTRTPKSVPGIECFHGPDGLTPFLERCEILVNLLALTAETENMLDAALFARLPAGASVVNLARGHHVVDADLIAALDSGHLAAATLDVFRTEPLPPDHPFWAHPRITVTPHAARTISPAAIIPQVAENIRRVAAGQPPVQPIDRASGY